MSKITLTPNASGTGTFTIQSPDSNTNRTFTLPDEDGELSVGGGGLTADFVASGAIGNGKVVSLKSDGTVTLSEASGASTPVDLSEDGADYWNVAYDVNADKVVVVYKTSSGTGEAMVGTVSAGSITFGTPVVFYSSTLKNNAIEVVYSEDAQKVVVLYTEDGTYGAGYARVGTVSGTSISFGTAVNINPTTTSCSITQAVYDTNVDKLVVVYQDWYGQRGYVRVGTISGTSISFGSQVGPEGDTNYVYPNSIYYDPNAQKVLVTYSQNSNLYARVGTVSGTSISFGAKSGSIAYDGREPSHSYDPVAQKSIVAYRVSTTSGVVRTTNISGTTVSFGTPNTFYSSAISQPNLSYNTVEAKTLLAFAPDADSYAMNYAFVTLDGDTVNVSDRSSFTNERTQYFNMVYDPVAEQHVLVYRFYNSPNEGKAGLFNVAPDIPIIGIAEADIADAASGPITVLGGINSSQTGLTVGEDYILDFGVNGGLAVGLPSDNRYIGKALSATQIVLKGL